MIICVFVCFAYLVLVCFGGFIYLFMVCVDVTHYHVFFIDFLLDFV